MWEDDGRGGCSGDLPGWGRGRIHVAAHVGIACVVLRSLELDFVHLIVSLLYLDSIISAGRNKWRSVNVSSDTA